MRPWILLCNRRTKETPEVSPKVTRSLSILAAGAVLKPDTVLQLTHLALGSDAAGIFEFCLPRPAAAHNVCLYVKDYTHKDTQNSKPTTKSN